MSSLLAEPVHHQQPVVDAETDAQHVHDVDGEDRHVAQERRADQHGKRREHTPERHEQRHAGGDDATEQDHHDDDGDRERDRLTAQQVALRRRGERLAHQDIAADEHLGRVELMGELLDLVGERQLGVLVEVTGQRDHHERSASVGGPQRVGLCRPGIGDIDHTVEGRDRRDPGRDRSLDLRIVDVDAVGDDRQLPTRPGQVVELLGDPAGLGRRSRPEVGRQDRERRAADGGRDDEEHDPREDDGAAAPHDETRQPTHHATTEPVEAPTMVVAGCNTR